MNEHLIDGGVVRKLWLGETPLYREHLLRLDSDSRRNRFGGIVSDEFINAYTEPSRLAEAIIHGFFVGGVLRGAAELRVLPRPHEGEAAFSIEKPWQSHGIGTALLERTLLAARNREIRLLHMTCLAENRRMQQLALKFDAELTFDFGSVVGELEAPHPTPISLVREFVADSTGFATAMLDVQSRWLKTA